MDKPVILGRELNEDPGRAPNEVPGDDLYLALGGGGETLSLREAFAAAVRALRQSGTATPELDARVLLLEAAKLTPEAYIRDSAAPLCRDAAQIYEQFIARRLGGEPVSRIVGFREFYGRRFLLSEATLDPRPDSEVLIDAALGLAGSMPPDLRVLDLGTGSGCLLITLLAEMTAPQGFDGPRGLAFHPRGLGLDRSFAALVTARENAVRLGVSDQADFICADWSAPLCGRFDLIVANPPYIPSEEIEGLDREVRLFDPRGALDGGADGLAAYRQILEAAGGLLAPEGLLLFEIGASQADAVRELAEHFGLMPQDDGWLRRDLAGRPRCIVLKIDPAAVRRS